MFIPLFKGFQPSQIGGAGFRWPIHSISYNDDYIIAYILHKYTYSSLFFVKNRTPFSYVFLKHQRLGSIAEACTMLPLKLTRTWRRVCHGEIHGKIMGKWEFVVIFRFFNGGWWDFRLLSLDLSNMSYRPVEISPKNQETCDLMGLSFFFWRDNGLPHHAPPRI